MFYGWTGFFESIGAVKTWEVLRVWFASCIVPISHFIRGVVNLENRLPNKEIG